MTVLRLLFSGESDFKGTAANDLSSLSADIGDQGICRPPSSGRFAATIRRFSLKEEGPVEVTEETPSVQSADPTPAI